MNRFLFLLTGVMAGWLTWNIEVKAESLEEVLGEALLVNPQAKVALNRLKARQEAIGKAKAGFWPSLDIAAAIGGQSKDTPNDAEDDKHTYTRKEASFSIKQSLFAGFNTLNSVREAKKNSQAEQWRLFSTLEELALKIINVYLKVLERSDLVELAEE
ncbi:MAG: TolC family protein, partial [Endozoicomonas sp.]